jgi:hypothetical protein
MHPFFWVGLARQLAAARAAARENRSSDLFSFVSLVLQALKQQRRGYKPLLLGYSGGMARYRLMNSVPFPEKRLVPAEAEMT